MKCNLQNQSMSDNLHNLIHPKLSASYVYGTVNYMNVLLECSVPTSSECQLSIGCLLLASWS